MSTINMNQFKKAVILGQLDLNVGGLSRAMTVRLDPDSTATDLIPGTGLALKDGSTNDPGGVPLVDEIAGDGTRATGGILVYSPKQGKYNAGDLFQAAQDGDIIYMNSAAALARGVEVGLDQSAPGTVQALAVDIAKIGVTLDKASGANVLIRVRIERAAAIPST